GIQTLGSPTLDDEVASTTATFFVPSVSPGKVYARIITAGTRGTNYTLTYGFSPLDNAGDNPSAALDLGVLGATVTKNDSIGVGPAGFMNDQDDFYRFTLDDAGPYNFTAKISGLSANADIALWRDDNLDQQLVTDEFVAFSSNLNNADDTISKTLFVPGV